MAYNLTNEERETIILFNEAEKTASISTFNSALIRKIKTLCESRPDEASGDGPDQNGEYLFTVPKKWIKVNATIVLSEETKNLRSGIAKRMNSK